MSRRSPSYIVLFDGELPFCYFQTIGDQLPLVSFDEFYIHTNRAEINKAQAITRWLKMD